MSDPYTVVSTLEFPYRRSLGSVIGASSLAFKEGKILGSRTAGGDVLVPPHEYDPQTGTAVDEMVEVGPGGVVTSWTWVAHPTTRHPLDRPFAFALIQLDGATTSIVHAVDVADSSAVSTGMRVAPALARRTRRTGHRYRGIRPGGIVMSDASTATEPVVVDRFCTLTYTDRLPPSTIRFAEALLEGKILGQKCPQCGRVWLPGKDYCPIDSIKIPSGNDVEVADHGVVTGHTIITPVRYYGQTKTEPFIYASVLLEGSSSLLGGQEITGIPIDQVRDGMRVKAVWKPVDERSSEGQSNRGWVSVGGAIENFEWTGEPDATREEYEEHVI